MKKEMIDDSCPAGGKVADMPETEVNKAEMSHDSLGAAQSAEAEKSKAALSSVLWSGVLTVTKIVAALSSNSLGLLSEALHSALDLLAAGITYIAVKISAIPADEKHPFGHGKVENLSALVETALLFVTCAWILKESVERLFFSAVPVEPNWWVVGVVVFSLVVDINRSAMLRRVAKEHRSQALEADALHFTTDIWSSAVVLLGLLCVICARFFEAGSMAHTLLNQADAVAALGVAVIILKVSWGMAARSVTALLDGGSEEEAEKVREALQRHAPAYSYSRIRVRDSGAGYFVDIVAETPAGLRVDVAHDVSEMMEKVVESVLGEAETTVHIEPALADNAGFSPFAACYGLAAERGLELHNLVLTTMKDGLHVFVHMDFPANMPLQEAHDLIFEFEKDLQNRIGAVHVICHIEPGHAPEVIEKAQKETESNAHILLELRQVMKDFPQLCMCHSETIMVVGNHTALSFRCKIHGAVTVAEAHHQAALLEAALRLRLPHLGRITIQVEPVSEDL